MVVVKPRLLTVQEYHRMIEAGIFGLDERIELVLGQLISMVAKGSPHSAAVTRGRDLLADRFSRRQTQIRVQEPVTLEDHSEPEPDLALVNPDPTYYEARHPQASDVLLIIEVSDSTLSYDREVKSRAYAKAGILDYWVLDLKNRQLHVYRDPMSDGYGQEVALGEAEMIAPLAFPTISVRVGDFLGQTGMG